MSNVFKCARKVQDLFLKWTPVLLNLISQIYIYIYPYKKLNDIYLKSWILQSYYELKNVKKKF